MDIQAKLDSIQEQKESLLNLTPAQHKSKNLTKLYQDVVNARSTEQDAPVSVKEAERRYYIARDGPDGYVEQMKKAFSNEARTVRQEMLSKHADQMNNITKALQYYDSVRSYLKNIAEVLSSILQDIKTSLEKIRNSQVDTNNRKSYYMEQEQRHILTWILVFNCFIFSYACILLVKFRDQLKKPIISGTIAVLFSFVFLLPFFVNLFMKIPSQWNVYTEWGFDPTESKRQWYWIIPIGMITLWVIVKHLAQRQFI
jgi:hypothetical protein